MDPEYAPGAGPSAGPSQPIPQSPMRQNLGHSPAHSVLWSPSKSRVTLCDRFIPSRATTDRLDFSVLDREIATTDSARQAADREVRRRTNVSMCSCVRWPDPRVRLVSAPFQLTVGGCSSCSRHSKSGCEGWGARQAGIPSGQQHSGRTRHVALNNDTKADRVLRAVA